MENVLNFAELVTRKTLVGDKKTLDQIADKRIVVTGYRITNSKYQKPNMCVTLQFFFEGDSSETKYVVFTGSGVICDQLEEVIKKFEELGKEVLFATTISKVGKYYAMT